MSAEVAGYLLYAVPVALYVLWPQGLRLRRVSRREPVTAGRTA